MIHWPRGNGGYEQLGVPLPAAEDRMYPSLQERDNRILSPPGDAAAGTGMSPSAPVYGVMLHPAQQAALYSASGFLERKNNEQPPHLPRPNVAGYVPVPNEPSQPGAPGILPPPAASQFANPGHSLAPSVHQPGSWPQPPSTVEELRERVQNLPRSDFSIHSLFTLAWRLFTKNMCTYFGAQLLILLVLIVVVFLWAYLVPQMNLSHRNVRILVFVGLLYLVGGCLLILPMFFALTFTALRAIQLNRFISIGKSREFFATKYCSFLCLSFIHTLCIFPFFGIFAFLLSFIFFLFFSLTLPIKYQFPALGTFKAMGLSAKISRKHFCKMFGLTLLLFLMNGIGFLAFGIGLLITVPMTIGIYAYLYQKLIGMHSVSGYTYVEGRADEYAYDGTGMDPDFAARNPTAPGQYIQLITMQSMQMPVPAAPVLPAPVVQGARPMMGYPADVPQRV